MEWKPHNDNSIDPTILEAIRKIQKVFENKILSPMTPYKEKIEVLCSLTDKEIEAQGSEFSDYLKGKGLFDSLQQSRALISYLNWLLRGDSRISYDVGAINRVLKEYARTASDPPKKELINTINFSLILLDLRTNSSSLQKSKIWECIFSYCLAQRLKEKICDNENDFFEFLKCQIMQDIIVPIKSICEKTVHLIIKYLDVDMNSLYQDGKYWHLKNICTILEYLLKNNAVSGDEIFQFDKNFFILSILIGEARNISIHGSSGGAECAQLIEEPCKWTENNTGEQVIHYINLLVELELKDTIKKRLSSMRKYLEPRFPLLAREIQNLLKAHDSTFDKEVSIEKENLGFEGCFLIKKWTLPRIDEKQKIIQIEVPKLLESLHSYIWRIFFFFCFHLDSKMLGNNG